MTGTHPRHGFLARAVAQSKLLAALVLEQREDHLPEPPDDLPPATRELFKRHFAGRAAAEARFFGGSDSAADGLGAVEQLRISREELNGPRTWAFLEKFQPDLLLSYGVHKLTPETLARSKGFCWNIHGGLSPWYRGTITHFWPSYLLEPQMTGMTVHETTEAIDGGAVVHQTCAELVRGDGLQDLACRAVVALAQEIPTLLARANKGALKPPIAQKTHGRIWRDADWRPAHLHLVYDYYDDHIVDRFLDGDFPGAMPRLVRQF
jgi:folate-dependent phosphoribosylglycinamide formyltransferase PurN